MTMTPDELDACRVFLAAYRAIPHNGRIEVLKSDRRGRETPVSVRIVHLEHVTASATIRMEAEHR